MRRPERVPRHDGVPLQRVGPHGRRLDGGGGQRGLGDGGRGSFALSARRHAEQHGGHQPHVPGSATSPAFHVCNFPSGDVPGNLPMNRRVFVVSLGGGLVALGPRGVAARRAIRVDATPTLFHGHPDGATTLVRFDAWGTEAPAGRLRVHDLRTGRQIGTAGMIRRDDRLTGELWLPLTAPTRVRSELETPEQRGAIRTVHGLVPTSRWTVYWLTLAGPGDLLATFADVPALLRGAEASVLVPAGIRLNPWHRLPSDGDHLDLVRITMPAARASRATGIPLGRVALVDGVLAPHLARALEGAGVAVRLHRNAVVDPLTFDLAAGRTQAAPRIEGWLRTREAAQPDAGRVAVAIGTDPAFATAATAGVAEWNDAYAFPKIVLGDGDEAVRVLAGVGRGGGVEEGGEVGEEGAAVIGTPTTMATDAFGVLGRVVAPENPTLQGIAARFAFPVGGRLVFNPSPFGRSDVVTTPGGDLRIVTDVPGLGYAFVPEEQAPAITPGDDPTSIETRMFRIAIERSGGAIREMVHRDSGRDLVAPGGVFDGLADGVLSAVRTERIAGVGSRLAIRRVTARHVAQSTVTAYDALPWVDIETEVVEGPESSLVDRTFAFADAIEHVTWEVPGGTDEAAVPVESLRPLRWTALRGATGTVLLGTSHRADLTVTPPGTVTVRTRLATRLRIGVQTGHLLPDDPWRFGFGMLPLAPVVASGRGALALKSFGRLFDIADPAVAVLAVRPAEDGTGTMVFLQELGGPSRDIVIRPDVLTFETGLLTDLAERDLHAAATAPGGGILVPIEASGWAAVRLLGVGRNGRAERG